MSMLVIPMKGGGGNSNTTKSHELISCLFVFVLTLWLYYTFIFIDNFFTRRYTWMWKTFILQHVILFCAAPANKSMLLSNIVMKKKTKPTPLTRIKWMG